MVVAGLLLLVLPRLVQGLTHPPVLLLSVLWWLSAAFLLGAASLVLRTWMGKAAAGTLVALGALSPIVLTTVSWPSRLAVYLPCHRNWSWTPAWLLRPSPIKSVSFAVGGTRVKLCYGQPSLRGRRMLGGANVPYGRLWRTGANEPTTLITPTPLSVAHIVVPPGRAAIYTIPGDTAWVIVLNRQTSQWGLESEYTDAVIAQELARVTLPTQSVNLPVERLTFSADPEAQGDSDRTDLVLTWGLTRLRIPIRPTSQ